MVIRGRSLGEGGVARGARAIGVAAWVMIGSLGLSAGEARATTGAAAAPSRAASPRAPIAQAANSSYARCLQKCFDKYIDNLARCKSALCTYILFVRVGCEDPAYGQCLAKAEEVYEACKESCGVEP